MATKTAAQLKAELEAAEAREAAANHTNGNGNGTTATLQFVKLAAKPTRTQSTGKSYWGIEPNAIPLLDSDGDVPAVKLFDGVCDASEHKSAAAYVGQPFTMFGLGRCGDHGGERMHKSCQAPGKAACGGHVFDVRMADGRGGCTSCARKQRKAIEAGK